MKKTSVAPFTRCTQALQKAVRSVCYAGTTAESRMAGITSTLFGHYSELAENRRHIITEQFFANLVNVFVAGNYLTGFLVLLNLNDFAIGNITVITSLGNVFQVFSHLFLRKFRSKKNAILCMRTLFYLIDIVFIGVIPFFKASVPGRTTAVFICVFLMTFIGAVVAPGISAWQMKSIPQEIRYDYFSFFTVALNVVVFAASFCTAKLVDAFKSAGQELAGLSTLRLIAIAAAVFDLLWLRKIREYPEPEEKEKTSLRMFAEPLKNRKYRKSIKIGALWTFTSSITGQYYNLYLLKDLHVAYSTMALVGMSFIAALLLFVPVWNRVVKRISCYKAIGFLMAGFLLHYFMLSLVTKQTIFLYPVGVFYSYIFYTGITVIINTLPFVNIPETGQIGHIGCYSAVTSVAAFFGAETGTLFIAFTSGLRVRALGIMFSNEQMLMVFTALLMLGGVLCIFRTNRRSEE